MHGTRSRTARAPLSVEVSTSPPSCGYDVDAHAVDESVVDKADKNDSAAMTPTSSSPMVLTCTPNARTPPSQRGCTRVLRSRSASKSDSPNGAANEHLAPQRVDQLFSDAPKRRMAHCARRPLHEPVVAFEWSPDAVSWVYACERGGAASEPDSARASCGSPSMCFVPSFPDPESVRRASLSAGPPPPASAASLTTVTSAGVDIRSCPSAPRAPPTTAPIERDVVSPDCARGPAPFGRPPLCERSSSHDEDNTARVRLFLSPDGGSACGSDDNHSDEIARAFIASPPPPILRPIPAITRSMPPFRLSAAPRTLFGDRLATPTPPLSRANTGAGSRPGEAAQADGGTDDMGGQFGAKDAASLRAARATVGTSPPCEDADAAPRRRRWVPDGGSVTRHATSSIAQWPSCRPYAREGRRPAGSSPLSRNAITATASRGGSASRLDQRAPPGTDCAMPEVHMKRRGGADDCGDRDGHGDGDSGGHGIVYGGECGFTGAARSPSKKRRPLSLPSFECPALPLSECRSRMMAHECASMSAATMHPAATPNATRVAAKVSPSQGATSTGASAAATEEDGVTCITASSECGASMVSPPPTTVGMLRFDACTPARCGAPAGTPALAPDSSHAPPRDATCRQLDLNGSCPDASCVGRMASVTHAAAAAAAAVGVRTGGNDGDGSPEMEWGVDECLDWYADLTMGVDTLAIGEARPEPVRTVSMDDEDLVTQLVVDWSKTVEKGTESVEPAGGYKAALRLDGRPHGVGDPPETFLREGRSPYVVESA